MILAFGSIGGSELLLIFLVVLLIFGAKRIPEIARAMGRALHEFKRAKDDIVSSVDSTSHPTASDKKKDEDQKKDSSPRQQ